MAVNVDYFSIRPAKSSDLYELVAFLARIYGLSKHIDKMSNLYKWKYFDLVGRETGYPSAFVLRDRQGVAGFIGCLPFLLHYDGNNYAACWIADWRIAHRVRGLGYGRKLLETAIRNIPNLACVDGSTDAQRIFRAFGFQSWTCATQWNKINYPFEYYMPKHQGIRKAKSIALAISTYVNTLATNHTFDSHIDIRENPDKLTSCPQVEPQNGMLRDKGYIGWLMRCPVVESRLFSILHTNKEIGFLVVFIDRDYRSQARLKIVDMSISTLYKNVLAEICLSVITRLAEQTKSVYIDMIIPSELTMQLRRANLRYLKEKIFWLKASEFTPDNGARWFLSMADKDNAIRNGYGIP